jgi:hypothetical protein
MESVAALRLLRLAEGRSHWVHPARGFGLTILASLVGSAASIRQILLHIVPPDPGYGPPVLGLHLYSWALVVFDCLIASSAIGLCGIREETMPLPRISVSFLCGLVLVIGITVALATFFMQGFNVLLPPAPARYELWHTFDR